MGLIFEKVANLQGADENQNHLFDLWRYLLLEPISSAEPPPEELVDHADILVAELNLTSALGVFGSREAQSPLKLMAQLPPTEIDKHIDAPLNMEVALCTDRWCAMF